MRLLLLLVTLLGFSGLRAQIGTGQWRMHIPASKAVDVAAGNGYVMTALKSGVLEYDIAAGENRILNKLNALSDIDVICITYEPQTKSFFVGYANGNIDQITPSGVINIPGIKLASVSGSKRINKIVAYNGLVYVAAEFALVVVDPARNEIKDTYYPSGGDEGINDVALLNDSIYALTDNHLFGGLASDPFLAIPSRWLIDTRVPLPQDSTAYKELGLKQNTMYLSHLHQGYARDTIKKLTAGGLTSIIGFGFPYQFEHFDIFNDNINLYFYDKMAGFDDNGILQVQINSYGGVSPNPQRVVFSDNYFWVADGINGLVRFASPNNFTYIQREGPPQNSFFGVNSAKDKVVVTGGTLDGVNFSYNISGAYTFQDESWTLYSRDNQAAWAGQNVWDVASAAINPTNTDIMALGAYTKDASVSIVNGATITNVYSPANSLLETSSVGNNNTCISSMEFDEAGNLWVVNCFTNEPLKVRTADGNWYKFGTGGITTSRFTGDVVIDYNGNKWFSVYNVGLVGFNDNETVSNTADDTYKILRAGEGLGNLPSEVVTALAVDFDNEIWIGTENGFAVLYNSDGIFSGGGIDASRILINYEGNVEDFLGDTPISDIEIDGGNRKWIATASSGIFLLSADGQELIQQFNTDNSPLISNNIMDMDFNHTTGELFIVTDKGLISYRTDASYEDQEYATTTVFPNPVKPDYFGPITIQGIRYDSDVKITDAAGNLVYQTTSNGGTATWNGKTIDGQEIASGVYLIWTATNTEKNKKVGKVVVIR